jgi:hypothetical protein
LNSYVVIADRLSATDRQALGVDDSRHGDVEITVDETERVNRATFAP